MGIVCSLGRPSAIGQGAGKREAKVVFSDLGIGNDGRKETCEKALWILLIGEFC